MTELEACKIVLRRLHLAVKNQPMTWTGENYEALHELGDAQNEAMRALGIPADAYWDEMNVSDECAYRGLLMAMAERPHG